jgi:valine dehydrogenase (NAD+)
VAIQGAGKVGARLAAHLLDDGARVVIADVNADAVARVTKAHPEVEVVAPDAIASRDVDVFSPCALGGTVTRDVTAPVVCGGANNQLATDGVADGVVYVPDFVANAGGIIQVGAEVRGYTEDEARALTMAIFDTTTAVLDEAARTKQSTVAVAEARAQARMRG